MSPRCYVFFDMDDTLIEWTVSWRDTFVQAAREVGVTVRVDECLSVLNTGFSTLYDECVRRHADSGDEREFWLAYDGRILHALGVGEGCRRAAERVVDLLTRQGSRRLFSEVPEVLEALSEDGVRLGIVTGRPRAEPDLEALGVRGYFETVIDAFSAGSAKSEGHMFRIAAEAAAEAGLPGWHVGDSYHGDVVGARAAGLRPVLVDRRGQHEEVDCPRIGNLRELLKIVLDGAR